MKCYLEIRLDSGRMVFQRPVESRAEAWSVIDDFFAIGSHSEGIQFVYVEYDDNYNEVEVVYL